MGAGDCPGCMLKVSHTLAARMCSFVFWCCGRCGVVVPLLCDLLDDSSFGSSFLFVVVGPVGAYVLGVVFGSYDLRFRHPWRSYGVLPWLVLLVSHYQFRSRKLVLFMFHPVVRRACRRCLGFVGRRMIVWVVRFIVQWFLSCRFDGGNAMALSCAADCASALPCFLFGW